MNVLIVGTGQGRRAARLALRRSYPSAERQEATESDAALAALDAARFDVVLLDDRLPDTRQLLDELRSRGSDPPVIVLTDTDDTDNVADMTEAGAAECLPRAGLTPSLFTVSLTAALRLAGAERRHREALRQNGFYAAIVASTDDAVIGKTLEGTILSWNAGAMRLYGYTAEEICGRNVSVLAPPERHLELAETMAQLRRGERIDHLETARVTKGGKRLDVSLTISPIYDAHGHLIGASTIAHDITERKAAEQKLRERAEREALVNRIGQVDLHSDDTASAHSTALALLGTRLEVDRCLYVLYHADQNTARIEKRWSRVVASPSEREWDLSESGVSVARLYEGGKTEVVADVTAAPLPPRLAERLKETGQHSYIAVPFFDRGAPVAALIVSMTSAARVWTEEEVALVEAAAVQIRADLESARARHYEREALARQRTFLHDVLASVTQGRLLLCRTARDLPTPLTELTATVPLSKDGGLGELRRETLAACRATGLAAERGHDLVTAVNEAGMNAVVHAGEGTGRIFSEKETGTVQVWVTDYGKGIALEDLPHATLMKGYSSAGTLGYGMKMILQTADRTFLLTGPEGTTVVIEQGRVAVPDFFS